jgi:hypothetical protein
MQNKNSEKPKKDRPKRQMITKSAGKKTESDNTNDNEFGGLPLHDLKKNLGCG